jgi:DNA processing protein
MIARHALKEDERRAWLRLARTENVGPTTFAALIQRFSDVHEALSMAPRLARRGGASTLRVPSEAEASDELDGLAALGGRIIAAIEPEFPAGLAALDPPPPIIAVIGHTQLLKREMIAVVGARNASASLIGR